jgi:hypothetical protein
MKMQVVALAHRVCNEQQSAPSSIQRAGGCGATGAEPWQGLVHRPSLLVPPPLPFSLSLTLSHQGRTSGKEQEKPKGTKVQAAQDTRAPARARLLRIIN